MMSAIDKTKVALASFIGLVGMYYSLLGMAQNPTSQRFGVFVATVVVSSLIMYFSAPGKQFVKYCLDTSTEVRKVVWPNREEVVKMSGVVLVFVTIVAIFLWLVDSLLGWLLQFLTL